MATIRAPCSWKMRDAASPTFPKPCTATRAPSSGMPSFFMASAPETNTPRPVASARPRLPPSDTGLPVTTPVAVRPTFMEYVSIIQAMVCGLVFTSGAGMSFSGPMIRPISVV